MQDKSITGINFSLAVHSNILWFLTLTYSMVIVLANWFDPRLIQIFGLTTDAGTLVFPITFLLSDLITEVYGYKYARRAIWCGFLFNLIFLIYGQLIIHLPNPDFQTNNAAFDSVLMMNTRIILASGISYFCSEPFNSYLMAKMKLHMQGRYMALRFILSTFIASAIDSMIFTGIAFYGTMSTKHLVTLAVTMWLIKVLIEIFGLPISLYLARKLKQLEKMDIYDKSTNFNIFSLETNYNNQDNFFFKDRYLNR